jgi:hypothetical protein
MVLFFYFILLGAKLHILCGEALLANRKEIAGQSFYAADYCKDYYEGHVDIDRALSKASQGKIKPREQLFSIIPRGIVYTIAFFANLVDWFFDGNVRHDIFNLPYFYAVRGYATGDLSCDNSRSIKLLNFEPMSPEECCERGARKYFN